MSAHGRTQGRRGIRGFTVMIGEEMPSWFLWLLWLDVFSHFIRSLVWFIGWAA